MKALILVLLVLSGSVLGLFTVLTVVMRRGRKPAVAGLRAYPFVSLPVSRDQLPT